MRGDVNIKIAQVYITLVGNTCTLYNHCFNFWSTSHL